MLNTVLGIITKVLDIDNINFETKQLILIDKGDEIQEHDLSDEMLFSSVLSKLTKFISFLLLSNKLELFEVLVTSAK